MVRGGRGNGKGGGCTGEGGGARKQGGGVEWLGLSRGVQEDEERGEEGGLGGERERSGVVMKGRLLGVKELFTADVANVTIELLEACDPMVRDVGAMGRGAGVYRGRKARGKGGEG